MAKHTITVNLTDEQEASLAEFVDSFVIDHEPGKDPVKFANVDEWLTNAVQTTIEGVLQRKPTPSMQAERAKIETAEAEIKRLRRAASVEVG